MLSLLRVELDETGVYDGKVKPLCVNAPEGGAFSRKLGGTEDRTEIDSARSRLSDMERPLS